MNPETADDRFSHIETFGREVVVALRKGETRPIKGIFDAKSAVFDPNRWPGSEYQMQSGAKFSSAGPRLNCISKTVSGVKQRDRVSILPNDLDDGGEYTVQDVQPDGTGFTVLVLIEFVE